MSANIGESHRIVVWQRGGRYFGRIEELGILANAADPQSLWQKLEGEVAAVRARFVEAGIANEFPSTGRPEQAVVDRPLQRFLVRLAAITGAALLFVSVASQQIKATGKDVAQSFRQELDVSLRLSRIVAGLENRTPEKREELHRNLRTLARELRPYLDDLQPLFEPSPSGGKAPAGPARQRP